MNEEFSTTRPLPAFEARLAELQPEIEALRARLMPEIGIQHAPDAKVLWKVLVMYQCLIRRTLELTDGIARAWRDREYLTSTLLARALTETAAFTWCITTETDRHVKAGELGAVSKLFDERMYSTRNPDWLERGLPKAVNILSMIDTLDHDMLVRSGQTQTTRTKVVRPHYDLLSDFAHPNHLGLAMVYGDLDREARTFRFTGPTQPDLERLSGSLGVSLTALIIVEGCLRTLDLFAEPLWKLNREAPYEREIT